MAVGTITAVGTVLGLILQGYGMYRQEKQYKEDVSVGERYRAEDLAIDERRYQDRLGLEKEAIAFSKSQARKKWAWEKEDRDYQRATDLVNNFRSLVTSKRAYQNDLANIWPRR